MPYALWKNRNMDTVIFSHLYKMNILVKKIYIKSTAVLEI